MCTQIYKKNHISTNYTARDPKFNFNSYKTLFLDRDMPISFNKTIDVIINVVKFN